MQLASKRDPKRPSSQLEAILTGKMSYHSAPASIRSWAEFSFYNAARNILKTKDRTEFNKLPPALKRRINYYIKSIKRR